MYAGWGARLIIPNAGSTNTGLMSVHKICVLWQKCWLDYHSEMNGELSKAGSYGIFRFTLPSSWCILPSIIPSKETNQVFKVA